MEYIEAIPVCDVDALSLQPNTFQLVIAYDPSRYQTFVMYIYKELGWDHQYFVRDSMIGYFSYKYTDENALQLAPSGKSTAFRMHERYGNKGEYICIFVYVSLSVFSCVRLSVGPSVRMSVCPSVRLSFCPSVRLSVCPSVRLSVCPSVRLSVCPSVRLSVCQSGQPARQSICQFFSALRLFSHLTSPLEFVYFPFPPVSALLLPCTHACIYVARCQRLRIQYALVCLHKGL